jgi:hypothetical protein
MIDSDTQLAQPRQSRLTYSREERIGLFALGLLLGILLLVAAWLTPDPTGQGTHTQLGLPGCTMFTVIGIRCPGCGMTTSWAHTLNGDIGNAIRANTGGLLLCLISMVASPALLWLAIRGKPFSIAWFSQIAITSFVVAISISFFEWLIRLAF